PVMTFAAWRRRLRDQRGIALVAVLWTMTLLALIAAVFMRETRTELALVRNLESQARAEALAEAGVNRAILILLGLDTSVPWRVDGTPIELASAEGVVRIVIQDEGGKIDLNRSASAVLQSLFIAVGAAPEPAHHLADAVVDFRDADDLRQLNGAEDGEYAAAGLRHDAKDAPFASTEELLQVLGMTPDLFERVEPLVTVYSPRRDVNLATAPAAVLSVLPYLTAERVRTILDQRTADLAGARRFRVIAVTVLVEAITADGARFIREAVLRRSAAGGFDILKWRRIWPTPAAASG
ncbi:MAG: general secretion pathway protein GspK, partial [Dongiaceae bacterium]